jgi:hypothetical protein
MAWIFRAGFGSLRVLARIIRASGAEFHPLYSGYSFPSAVPAPFRILSASAAMAWIPSRPVFRLEQQWGAPCSTSRNSHPRKIPCRILIQFFTIVSIPFPAAASSGAGSIGPPEKTGGPMDCGNPGKFRHLGIVYPIPTPEPDPSPDRGGVCRFGHYHVEYSQAFLWTCNPS